MRSTKLSQTTPYLRDPAMRKRGLLISVASSTAITDRKFNRARRRMTRVGCVKAPTSAMPTTAALSGEFGASTPK